LTRRFAGETAAADLRGLVAESTARFGVELSTDALSRLARFVDLLALWNRRVHLTGERDPCVLVRKHVLDCLAPVPHLPPAGVVVDVGSGAGLPGLVLGCARPDLDVCLLESRRRPASFLREAVRTIPLPRARVVEERAETVAEPDVVGKARVVIARAVRLETFLAVAARLVGPDGVVIAMQTPGAVAPAAVLAEARLRSVGAQDYELPGGERRRLLFFAAMC